MSEWQPPKDPSLDVHRLAAAGLVAAMLGVISTALIGGAYEACDPLDAGGRAALNVIYFPAITIVAWAAFGVGMWATRSLGVPTRFLSGALLAIAVCLMAIAISVPIYGEAFWAGPPPAPGESFAGTAQCGPGGIPTWWPVWLPH